MDGKMSKTDYVQDQGKLVIQVAKERKAAREWEEKWGFMSNIREMEDETALEKGMTKEEYREMLRNLVPKYMPYVPPTAPKQSKCGVPITSSGMIGWRVDQPLEKREPPIVAPLPPEEPLYSIFLG